MNKMLRLSLLAFAVIAMVGWSSCYASKPHGCGCGMEEHLNLK